MDIVEAIYRITNGFPKEELYGLTSQMRRAAVSIPSNISEGAVGRSEAQFINYLTISLGSLSELDTQIELSFRLNYISPEEFEILLQKTDSCKALIFGLKKAIQKRKQ